MLKEREEEEEEEEEKEDGCKEILHLRGAYLGRPVIADRTPPLVAMVCCSW